MGTSLQATSVSGSLNIKDLLTVNEITLTGSEGTLSFEPSAYHYRHNDTHGGYNVYLENNTSKLRIVNTLGKSGYIATDTMAELPTEPVILGFDDEPKTIFKIYHDLGENKEETASKINISVPKISLDNYTKYFNMDGGLKLSGSDNKVEYYSAVNANKKIGEFTPKREIVSAIESSFANSSNRLVAYYLLVPTRFDGDSRITFGGSLNNELRLYCPGLSFLSIEENVTTESPITTTTPPANIDQYTYFGTYTNSNSLLISDPVKVKETKYKCHLITPKRTNDVGAYWTITETESTSISGGDLTPANIYYIVMSPIGLITPKTYYTTPASRNIIGNGDPLTVSARNLIVQRLI